MLAGWGWWESGGARGEFIACLVVDGGRTYHELGVLDPWVGVKGDEEILFSHGLLGGAWRGSRGRRRGRVHRRQGFVSSG